MSDPNFSAIRAKLRYETIEDFIQGYSRFISGGGMFIPMRPSNLKPIGTTIRFQFLLGDGSTAMLGEGLVLQVREPTEANPRSPVGMLVKFTKLSQESKALVDRVLADKSAAIRPNAEGAEAPVQKHPTKPFPEDGEESEAEDVDGTKESHRDIVQAAQRAALAASAPADEPGISEGDKTPFPPEASGLSTPTNEAEDEAVAAVASRAPIETPVSNGGYLDDMLGSDLLDEESAPIASNAEETSPAEDEAPAEPEVAEEPEAADVGFELNLDFDSEPEEEPEPAVAEEPAIDEEPEVEEEPEPEVEEEPEPEPEVEEEPEPEVEEEPELEISEEDPPTREAPEASVELPTAETPAEPETREHDGLDLELALEDGGLQEGSQVQGPTQLGQTEGGLQILAFDEADVSDEAMKALENFSFDAGEDDIDGMFDGLFGSAEDEDDFFSALGGGGASTPTTGESLSSVEFELPADQPEEEEDASSDDISLDDAFGSEAEAEPEPSVVVADPQEEEEEFDLGPDFADPEPVPETPSLQSNTFALESEAILSSDDMSEAEPSEAPAVPPSPESELGDESSPVLDLQDEADEEDLFLDQALGFNPAANFEEPEEEHHEIDDLLGNLDAEDEEPQELTLHLGGEPEPEPEPEDEDEESLEALLASAKKEIEEKHPTEPPPSGDIIDQLMGDDDSLPLPPSDAPAFNIEKKEKKKGFMSKLFGKD